MLRADSGMSEAAKDLLNRDRGVFLACDARQAFHLAEQLDFCAALVDLDRQGNEALPLILKVREGLPELPVIAISSQFKEC